MLTTRRSLACAVSLVFALGCSGSQETGPRWVPVLDDNGRIVYYPEGEEPVPVTSATSGNVAQLPAPDDAETRQRRQDERYARDMAEWRRNQEEQARRDRQEESAQEEATRKLRQELARQERASWKNYIDQDTYRRQAREREALASQRAEALRQQQETAGWQRIQRQQDVMMLNTTRSGNGGGVDDRFSRPIGP